MTSLNQSVSLDGTDVESKRAEIKRYFNHTWQQYQQLFDLINTDDAYFLKAEPLRHPLIFYFGHTATFYINKLKLARLIDERINPEFESMFAIGVDEMSWDDVNSQHYAWPSVCQVRRYRDEVSACVNQVIDNLALSLPITAQSPAWLILMGIEHERIHLETSSVIIRQLPLHLVTPSSNWHACESMALAPSNQLLHQSGGTMTLGKAATDMTYGWDNEYGQQSVTVNDFEASRYLVSNQEYLAFVEAGGYQTLRWWTQEGQQWLNYTQAQHPRFWRKHQGLWWQRNLTEEIPLPLNWPVEVNYLEAKAFCHYLSEVQQSQLRLPTEAEWYCLRQNVSGDSQDWQEIPANLGLAHFASSCPVNRFEHQGFYDVIGNVWQWSETAINGLNGFEVHPMYDDFSTPTFDGRHNLIKGGSWISTGNEMQHASRYAFRRHFYQHAGFRYVRSAQALPSNEPVNIYETDELISQYLEFHYGDSHFGVANFCVNAVASVMAEIEPNRTLKALDIGCSVGRASFELAKHYQQVDAIDFSARFISQAIDLCEQGQKRWTITTEGELQEFKSVSLTQLNYQDLAANIHFQQGDACNLKPRLSGYDLIYAANLIDRLTDPHKFLADMPARLNSRGYLVILSPYTWLEQYTNKANWLGGFKRDAENFTSLDGLNEALHQDFELCAVKDIPFVIRETKRKFQHSISQLSIWRKRQ
ncbi:5-histidylcysteine sulfoxide synthase [Shewanella sp. SNU WT4]|uniref:5-histidylcysteine sulfoxide synthase n=1 Tax=Shewanella sp. SNU WT4 TaxID=2590015 RepID=UPI00112CBD66|nr:5-histidylcysteine sulfoxide synthase [Shewanella sp. SNU WT4]QDF65787.1 5-histidylcysteine sulfoxide synthase [Shewanella sp. SNU WT4]